MEPSQGEERERRVNSEDTEIDEAASQNPEEPQDRLPSPSTSSIHSSPSKSQPKGVVNVGDAEEDEDKDGGEDQTSGTKSTPPLFDDDDDAKSSTSNLLTPSTQSNYSLVPPLPRSTNPSNWNRHQKLRLSPSASPTPSRSSRHPSHTRCRSRSYSSPPSLSPRQTLFLRFIHDPISPRQETMARRLEIREEWKKLKKTHEEISKQLFLLDQEVRRLDVKEVLADQGYRLVGEEDWEDEDDV